VLGDADGLAFLDGSAQPLVLKAAMIAAAYNVRLVFMLDAPKPKWFPSRCLSDASRT
jgi:hypothetical protein